MKTDTPLPFDLPSTISRLENAPGKTEAARLAVALLDQFGATVKPGKMEILDIDDTFCAAHGGQSVRWSQIWGPLQCRSTSDRNDPNASSSGLKYGHQPPQKNLITRGPRLSNPFRVTGTPPGPGSRNAGANSPACFARPA